MNIISQAFVQDSPHPPTPSPKMAQGKQLNPSPILGEGQGRGQSH
ncbi:hypothetical protein SAMD00079811_43250 [Scytonema sp. HK-05]|nr:hypothetical protein [Scytonema sp. HK-05]BAY46712.1 hypothetical protein SAMD00079811_43250 [Scytonema sp. HK-05]